MIAVITARGGSKGLPRKNVLPFRGRPLIAYTIEAATRSRSVDRVVVSTDSHEIAAVALDFGADVPFLRPAELASDTATSRDVLLHTLRSLKEDGDHIDSFCLLQPTSPLRTAEDIDHCCEIFRQRQADSVLSVVAYEHPVQWAVAMDGEGRLAPRYRKWLSRRQDMTVYYRPNGAVYCFGTAFFQSATTYFGPNSFGYVMPPERSIDIDTPLDFILAETVSRYLEESTHD